MSKTTINGQLENANGLQVFLKPLKAKEPIAVDTVDEKGYFSFVFDNAAMDLYRMSVESKKEQILLAFDSTQRDILISADVDNISRSYTVSGSKDSEMIRELEDKVYDYKLDLDSITKMQRSLPADADLTVRKAMSQQDEKLKERFDKELVEWALDNATSLAALPIIERTDMVKHLGAYQKIKSELAIAHPSSPFLADMERNLKIMQQQANKPKAVAGIGVGDVAPDIVEKSPDGTEVSLSSLKGKYVLIDFWASWCGPCRRENPNVRRLYDKYGGDKFEILGVSLDSNKERWIGAIAQDQLEWLHVSDLKKWNSKHSAAYGVRSIPHTVLVDPDGIVIGTKLRGAQLAKTLEELFGA